ncbi:hypothetical protein K439DRAFT_878914 [Ramaria rubella]|nr:hypothetical protein K439DRAFT_878914 [Ramaria rubella]
MGWLTGARFFSSKANKEKGKGPNLEKTECRAIIVRHIRPVTVSSAQQGDIFPAIPAVPSSGRVPASSLLNTLETSSCPIGDFECGATHCCQPGNNCCSDGGCCAASSTPQCCLDLGCCTSTEVCCNNGFCCPGGDVCCSGGFCCPTGTGCGAVVGTCG